MIGFREVTVDDAEMILRWRMSNRVTKFMNTDLIHDLELQKKWLAASYQKPDYYHWIITNNDQPIGLINLANYSPLEKSASWGFYIGEQGADGIGAFIPPYFYNYAFGELLINRINVEVFYNNTSVIGLHLLHSYKFSPSKDRVITKNGTDILLVAMTLDKEDWNFKRFSKKLATFPTTQWKAKSSF